MDQALVTIGLGYEVTLAATAECREALASQHRANEIMDGVLGQGAAKASLASGCRATRSFFYEFAKHEEDPPQLAGESPLGSGLSQLSSNGTVAHTV